MPLNAVPPTTSVENLHTKLKAGKTKSSLTLQANGKCWMDVRFIGGVIPVMHLPIW